MDTENTIRSNKVESTNWSSYTSIIFSTIAGAVIGRSAVGALVGLTASVIDEYLIASDRVNKHYFSLTIFGSQAVFKPYTIILTKYMPAYSLPIIAASWASSAAVTYYVDDFLDFRHKINIPTESLFALNRFFDKKEVMAGKEFSKLYNKLIENPVEAFALIKEDIREIYQNKFLFNFIISNAINLSHSIVDNLLSRVLGIYNNLFIAMLLRERNGLNSNHIAVRVVKKFAVFILKYQLTVSSKLFKWLSKNSAISILRKNNALHIESMVIISIFAFKDTLTQIIKLIQNCLSKESDKMIIDSGKESIIKNGDSKKILGADKQEGEKIIKSLIQDLFILKRGTQQLNTVTIQTAESIIALNNLMTLAPDALLPYTLISLIPHKEAFKWLVEKLKKIAQEEDLATRKAQNLLQDVASNVEQISLRHGEEFMEYEFNAQWQKLKILYSNYTHTNILRNALDDLMQIHNKVVDVLYLGDKVLQNKLTMDEVTIVHGSVNKVYSFFLSNLNVQINNIELVQAKTRIDKFYHLLNTTSKHAVRTINEENKVIFRNYTLKLNQKEIVHIDYLSLDKGNRYAITGDSGCGKSSMMIDLKEGVIGALNSEGEISLPKNADIIFLNQHLYLPKGSTLLEAVYFPKVLSKLTNKEVIELKKQITILFDEFGMDPGFVAMLDSQEYKLSGGELQKIGLMSAAINQLEEKSKQDEEKVIILILDESLTGLDQGALIATQKAITKYFKDAIVLVIDHHAHDNNYDQFYDKEMHYSTYSYKLLQNHDSVLKETEIGLFLNQAHKLFAKLENLKGLEIKIATKKNKVGISAELYFKIKAALNDTHFDQFKLEVEEKQQIISFTSSQNYTTKNAWIISKEIALRPLDDEYMSHHSSCFGPMDELYTRMNEGNALKIVTESDNILCQTICGKCSHHLYDD